MMTLVLAIGLAQVLMLLPALALISRQSGVGVLKLLADQSLIVLAFVLAWLAATYWVPMADVLGAVAALALFTVIMIAAGGWIFRHDLPILFQRGRKGKA